MKHIQYTVADQDEPEEIDECIKKLFVAIVHRAILDMFAKSNSAEKRDATFWLLENTTFYKWSFPWICHYLNINRDMVVGRLQEMRAERVTATDPALMRIFRVETYDTRPVAPVKYTRRPLCDENKRSRVKEKYVTNLNKLRQCK